MKHQVMELFPEPTTAMIDDEFNKTKCESMVRHMNTQLTHAIVDETLKELRRMKEGLKSATRSCTAETCRFVDVNRVRSVNALFPMLAAAIAACVAERWVANGFHTGRFG